MLTQREIHEKSHIDNHARTIYFTTTFTTK